MNTNEQMKERAPDGGPVHPIVYTRPRMTSGEGGKIMQVPELVASHGQSTRTNMVTEYVKAMLTHGGMRESEIVPVALKLADKTLMALGVIPEPKKPEQVEEAVDAASA